MRLRATDGTADVTIGMTPKTLKSLPTDIKPTPIASTASPAQGASRAISGRSSVHSSISEAGSAKSRSVLSGDGEKAPVVEGNVQFGGGFECGERVISVLHSPDGNAVST